MARGGVSPTSLSHTHTLTLHFNWSGRLPRSSLVSPTGAKLIFGTVRRLSFRLTRTAPSGLMLDVGLLRFAVVRCRSVGAVLVEMATGQPPWSDLVPVAALFKLGSPDAVPPIPAFLSVEARHFLGLCFTRYQSRLLLPRWRVLQFFGSRRRDLPPLSLTPNTGIPHSVPAQWSC
jgi:hypothetical protein